VACVEREVMVAAVTAQPQDALPFIETFSVQHMRVSSAGLNKERGFQRGEAVVCGREVITGRRDRPTARAAALPFLQTTEGPQVRWGSAG
jgi:hypothetical protein